MEFLMAVNKILDIKVVQYALVVGVISLGILSGVQSTRLHFAAKAAETAAKERDDARASVALQNASIDALKAAGEAQVKSMESAVAKARALAVEQEKKAKSLRAQLANLPENDCQGAVDGFIDLVPLIVGGDEP